MSYRYLSFVIWACYVIVKTLKVLSAGTAPRRILWLHKSSSELKSVRKIGVVTMDWRCFVLLTEYLNRCSEVVVVFLRWIHNRLAFWMKVYVRTKDFKVRTHPMLMCALIVNVLIWYWSKGLHGYLDFGGISNNASINVWRQIPECF